MLARYPHLKIEMWGTRAVLRGYDAKDGGPERWWRGYDAQGGAQRGLEVGIAMLGEFTAQRDAEDDQKRADGWDEEEIHGWAPF